METIKQNINHIIDNIPNINIIDINLQNINNNFNNHLINQEDLQVLNENHIHNHNNPAKSCEVGITKSNILIH